MAKVCHFESGASNAAASTTLYLVCGVGARVASTTEAGAQVTYRSAGTLSLLYFRVYENSRGSSTFGTRVNGVNGNQSVSIGASTTGEFEDTVNTDSIVAGDEVK